MGIRIHKALGYGLTPRGKEHLKKKYPIKPFDHTKIKEWVDTHKNEIAELLATEYPTFKASSQEAMIHEVEFNLEYMKKALVGERQYGLVHRAPRGLTILVAPHGSSPNFRSDDNIDYYSVNTMRPTTRWLYPKTYGIFPYNTRLIATTDLKQVLTAEEVKSVQYGVVATGCNEEAVKDLRVIPDSVVHYLRQRPESCLSAGKKIIKHCRPMIDPTVLILAHYSELSSNWIEFKNGLRPVVATWWD